MDHKENVDEGGSSPDTLINQSSPEEYRKSQLGSVSAENVNAPESSSSSLETIVGVGMEGKKKGRFGSLKKSFRREGGFFKTKKKKNIEVEPSIEVQKEELSAKGCYKTSELLLLRICMLVSENLIG